ncbi:microtubule associated protein (ASE1) [Ceratobasidium sp. AG-Ba]|nr:microtubule associated protein (ASE1) [Ceratobasidium sp. AG-Ba]QRW07564.1 microtubule associated protein (ASE1) [Ceratobasidium sp. AG-Ba]
MSLTAQTLLASLHEHLAFHTALLPQLHAQLGLPPTALATELEELRKVLADAVEARVERRRQDVAVWAQRCDELEKRCKQYATAVGGPTIISTIKGIKNVAELAKEQNYPKRYELLQKNLQLISRVHATKLEQLSALHARLRALAEAVGHDFFPPDLLPPTEPEAPDPPIAPSSTGAISTRTSLLVSTFNRHPDLTVSALGPVPGSVASSTASVLPRSTSPADPSTTPPSNSTLPLPLPIPKSTPPPQDVSPAHFARLDRELQRGKQALTERRSQLASTLLHASWLMLEMGMTLPCEEDGWDNSGDEGDQVFVKFLKGLGEAEAEMEASGEPMGEDDGMKAAMRAVEGVVPKVEIVSWATELVSALEAEQSFREQRIQELYNQLAPLWTRLGVSTEEMEQFIENHQGCSQNSVMAYEAELARTKALKSEQMVTFIAHVRTEISQLWEALMMSDDERAEFACFWDDEPSEDLLTRHEDEAARLRSDLTSKHALLAKAQKWEAIVGEQRALAAAASDQSRLTGRGVRGDPGRLLREEKMRKRVQREKPKLEAELLKELTAWEEERGRPFTVEGVRFLDTIKEVIEAEQQDKENRKRGRAVTPTQAPQQQQRVPSRQGNGRAPSQDPPMKKQRTVSGDRPRVVSGASTVAEKQRSVSGPVKATPLRAAKNTAATAAPLGNGMKRGGPKSPTKGAGGDFVVMGLGLGMPSRRPGLPKPADPSGDKTPVPKPVAEVLAGRRQSFRPRPSLDAWVAGGMNGGTTRLPGMLSGAVSVPVGGVKEEDEC